MKIILSRKGFDSANGGQASPILTDGTRGISEGQKVKKQPFVTKSCRLSQKFGAVLNYSYLAASNIKQEK